VGQVKSSSTPLFESVVSLHFV